MKHKILIVEDDPTWTATIKQFLPGYELIFTEYGCDALDIIEKQGDNISIVLLDLGLPDMDGADILKSIKQKNLYTEIIIVTVDETSDKTLQCLELGAFFYIEKIRNIEAIPFLIKRALVCRQYRMDQHKRPPSVLRSFFMATCA